MLKNIIRRSLHLLTFLSGEGSWKLRSYEEKVLTAVFGSLDLGTQILVKSQLMQKYFVERIPTGKINVLRFYDLKEEYLIHDQRFCDLLYKVSIKVDGKKQIANVTFYKGRIFSIEFKNPGKYYLGKTIEVGEVKLGNTENSYTRNIDRSEHEEEA